MIQYFVPSDIEEIVERLKPFISQFSGKTIVLSGGNGFLGRYFVEIFCKINDSLVSDPLKLIVIDNLITSEENKIEDIQSQQIDFIKHDVIEKIDLQDKVDIVIHAAGIASPYYYRIYPLETLDVAITGTRRMLSLAKEAKAKMIFFSSSEIYGDPDPEKIPISEDYRGNVSSQGPRACYDESKRLGETLCHIYNTNFDVETNIIRPFNIFGPGMMEKDYRVLPNFASKIKGGQPVSIYGNGSQTRTFCYATDAMVGFFLVILNGLPGETYNIGNPMPEISVLQLIDYIKEVTGKRIDFNLINYPESYPGDEPMRRMPSILKATEQLGYLPEVELKQGLTRFLSWTEKVYSGV